MGTTNLKAAVTNCNENEDMKLSSCSVHTFSLIYLICNVHTGSMLDQFPDNPHISIAGCYHEGCLLKVLKSAGL